MRLPLVLARELDVRILRIVQERVSYRGRAAHFRLAGYALDLAGDKKRDFGFDDSTTLPCSE